MLNKFFATSIVFSVFLSSVWANDLAVSRLLEGEQPARRSQIPSEDQIAQVLKGKEIAQAIVDRNFRQGKKGMATIPSGKFLSGDENLRESIPRAYKLDITEVSNKKYRKFLNSLKKNNTADKYAHEHEPGENTYRPRYWGEYRSSYFVNSPAAKVAPFREDTFIQDENPVVGVDWWDAYAYCRWENKRLPNALEWEKAARGEQGYRWPWGNNWDYAKANTGGDKWGEVDGFIYAAPVVSFGEGVSPYGVLNLAGNVAEWSQEGMLLGGSSNSRPSAVRGSAKKMEDKNYRSFNIGFRCATDV